MQHIPLSKSWLKLKSTLTPMTWSQRVDHIWTYYKSTILIVVLFAFLIGYLLFGMLTKKDILLGGVHANVELSETGRSYITSGFFEDQQGNPNKEEVSILDVMLTEIADDEYFEMNYYYLQAVLSRVGAQHVDYILADKVAMEIFMTQDIYMDLREFFAAEELTQLEDRLIYFLPVSENDESTVQEKYPIAVDVSDLPFFKSYSSAKGSVYFSVAVNTANHDGVKDLWTYLLTNWNP